MTDADESSRMSSEEFHAQVRWERDNPWWRPGAMRPEERERLVRIGLEIVLGDRAGEVDVRRDENDVVQVSEETHAFGFPIDAVLGDDPRTVLEHDVEWLVDELSEMRVAWAKRLPECPLHPGSHPLTVTVAEATITASCPVTREDVRSAPY